MGERRVQPPADAATPDERARSALEAVRATIDHGWTDAQLDEFTPAVEAAAQHLEREGQATKKDFLREVALDHPAGFSTDAMEAYLDENHARDDYEGAWWRKVVRPALTQYPEYGEPQYLGGPHRWTA